MSEDSSSEKWFQTSELEDLADIVDSSALIAESLQDHDRHIRSLFVLLANGFGLALICVLRRTDGGGIWRDDVETKWLDYVSGNGPRPKEYVASPLVLWQRAKDKDWMSHWSGTELTSNERQDELIAFAAELRNQFHHFAPMGWSIFKPNLIDSCAALIDVIGQAAQHTNIAHHLPNAKRDEILKNLQKISGFLNSFGN